MINAVCRHRTDEDQDAEYAGVPGIPGDFRPLRPIAGRSKSDSESWKDCPGQPIRSIVHCTC